MFDDGDEVRPDGLTVRRLRHDRGWSPRSLVDEIARARFAATGLRETITPNLLAAIEERDEAVPYATLCLLSDALDCDPIDLVRLDQRDDDEEESDSPGGGAPGG